MLVEVAMTVLLTAVAQKCGPGESVFSITSGSSCPVVVRGSMEPSLLSGQSVESALADDLSLVPQVKKIFVERADGNLLVWIATDRPAKGVRERIFQKQFDLIDAFPEISFDFNIISTSAENPSEIASEAKLIYPA